LQKERYYPIFKDMLKAIYTFAFVTLGAISGFSQSDSQAPDYFDSNDSIEAAEGNKLSVGFTTGASVLVGGGNSFSRQFVAPTLNYQVSNRFSIGAGLLYSTGYQSFGKGESGNLYGSTGPSTSLFVNSRYRLNSNVTLLGAGVYTPKQTGSLLLQDPYNQRTGNMMMLGFEFGTGGNTTFTLSAGVSKGGSPFDAYGAGFGPNNFGGGQFGMMNSSSTGFDSPLGWR
jgi:hypothetical protein